MVAAGTWFQPIIATLVAGGGRLLLATAIHLVHQAGGEYVFCDTDGLYIAASREGGTLPCLGAPGGQITLLSWRQVDEITTRFATLNLYDPQLIGGSILRVEDINYDPDSGQQRPIWCLSVAAKRYALYETGPDGRPRIVGPAGKRKRCEHGLGHLLPPVADKQEDWITRWWEHLICLETGVDDPEPEWFDLAAIGRLTIASLHEADTFTAYNQNLPYQQQVRPFGFLNIAHPIGSKPPSPTVPAASSPPTSATPESGWTGAGGSTGTDPTIHPAPSAPATPRTPSTGRSLFSPTGTTSTPTADTPKPKPPDRTAAPAGPGPAASSSPAPSKPPSLSALAKR